MFTLNNPTDLELQQIREYADKDMKYMVFGHEIGESGTPHLQGYIELFGAMSISAIKKRFRYLERAHLEVRMGTRQQAIQYCIKDGEVEEFGELKGLVRKMEEDAEKKAGKSKVVKNKVLPFLQMYKDGMSLAEISAHPDCSAFILRHLRDVLAYHEEPRDRSKPLRVIWYYGPTGTGKTRRAIWEAESEFGPNSFFIKNSPSKWFDGYDAHKVAIFDDLRSSWFEYSFLLKLLDRYGCQVEVKGGVRQWKPDVVYITAPIHPKDMYSGMQQRETERDSIAQLLRRITTIEGMMLGTWQEPDPLRSSALAQTPKSPFAIAPPATPQQTIRQQLRMTTASPPAYVPACQELDWPTLDLPIESSDSEEDDDFILLTPTQIVPY